MPTDEMVEKAQTLDDAIDNALIAWGMGWDMDDVMACLKEAKDRAALEAAEAGAVPRAAVWRVVKDFHGEVSTYTVGSLVFVTSTCNGKATIEPVKGLGCVVDVPLDRLEYTGLYASPPSEAYREERAAIRKEAYERGWNDGYEARADGEEC